MMIDGWTADNLISREALKKKCAEVVKASNNSDFIPCPTWNKAMELIDNAPTVCGNNPKWCENCVSKGKCASTRPHGKWIKEYKDFKCSLCGKIAYSWNNHGTYIQIKSDFCPHCGADMRGEEDDN